MALGADFGLFMVAMSFASQSTILPAFAAHLGAPNLAIGAIPAAMTLGWFLPQLLGAHHTRRLDRRLPFVLRWTAGERLPFLVLAAVAFTVAERAPGAALTSLLGMLLVIATTGGWLMPAWMDIVSRCVPAGRRGRFFGVTNMLAGVAGFAGSLLTAWILARVAAPASYGVCFLLAAVFMGLSWWALALVREPPVESVAAPLALGGFVRMSARLLGRDRNLAWFLAARALSAVGSMAIAFYTVYALRVLRADEWQVGIYTMAMLAGQVVGNAGLGWVADHAGHRVTLAAGALAAAAASATALAAPSPEGFALVFALAGLYHAAISVSGQNALLDFATEPDERPTYLGVANTALAPVFTAMPILAGLIADQAGFAVVFGLALAGGLAGGAVLALRVREPGRAAAGA